MRRSISSFRSLRAFGPTTRRRRRRRPFANERQIRRSVHEFTGSKEFWKLTVKGEKKFLVLVTGEGHVSQRYHDLFRLIATSDIVDTETIRFGELDAYVHRDLAKQIGVRTIPTVLYGSGTEGAMRRKKKSSRKMKRRNTCDVRQLFGASSERLRETVELLADVSFDEDRIQKMLEDVSLKSPNGRENLDFVEQSIDTTDNVPSSDLDPTTKTTVLPDAADDKQDSKAATTENIDLDVETLTYAELRKEVKARGGVAKGKTHVLRQKLRDLLDTPLVVLDVGSAATATRTSPEKKKTTTTKKKKKKTISESRSSSRPKSESSSPVMRSNSRKKQRKRSQKTEKTTASTTSSNPEETDAGTKGESSNSEGVSDIESLIAMLRGEENDRE